MTVTLEELQTIADQLRPYTAEAMKIEVASWIRDYVVDMNELYTELALEKIHNKPIGQDAEMLNHYFELFKKGKRVSKGDLPEQNILPLKRARTDRSNYKGDEEPQEGNRGDKILMKGDPGMGKTTQCKKIGWDWAKGLFTYFLIVFFVFLKLVKPGEAIENAIIKQNPYMKGLKITEEKVRSILDTLGTRCLIILDGLDEHALGTNKEVLSFIRGEKYLKCNFLVTSRPHSTREIEKYFPTVARVEGFTRKKAEMFSSKILTDRAIIEAVLNYNPECVDENKIRTLHCYGDCIDFEGFVPIYKCPILLSFLCLLAREDDIDFLNTKTHTGEIYTRMVRCLYKKYVIRKGISFDLDQFKEAMISIGKLALKTLLSGDPLLKREDVMREIGEDAFDYGLLIGHEDAYRFVRDETADIFVTFPHRSIQEFLGALYFILMLDKGEEIRLVPGFDCDNPIFLTNTLFLQFCLWLLGDDQKYFTLENKQKIHQHMVHYCVDLFNDGEFDLERVERAYPALEISSASIYTKDKLRVGFVGDIIAKCNKISYLSAHHSLNQLMGFVNHGLKSVTLIRYQEAMYRVSCFNSTEIVLKTEGSTLPKLSVILKHYKKIFNDQVVYLHLHSPRSLHYSRKKSAFVNVKALCLSRLSQFSKAERLVTLSSNLTHLRLEQIHSKTIMKRTINRLSYCTRNLPHLSHLSIVNCRHFQRKISNMFQSKWLKLQQLSLLDTRVSETDLTFLCLACNGAKKTLPNLTSLCLTFHSKKSTGAKTTMLFARLWLNLKQLYVDYKFDSDTGGLCNAIKEQKLPNLTCLEIRTTTATQQARELTYLNELPNLQSLYLHNPRSDFQISLNTQMLLKLGIFCSNESIRSLPSLTSHIFPLLRTLVLSNSGLISQDLTNLAHAKMNEEFPVLKHLDLSCNNLTKYEIMCLFDGPCFWNELISLDLRTEITRFEVMNSLNNIVRRGYLSSLQEFGINHSESKNVFWKGLEKLFLIQCKDDALVNIADAIRSGFLPALRTLCIQRFEGYDAEIVRTLSQLGVTCHQTCNPLGNEFFHKKCHCETQII